MDMKTLLLALVLAPLGTKQTVYFVPRQEQGPTAPDGFKVELLRTATPEEGSWVAMTFDRRGRLIVSPEQGALRRITVGRSVAVERIAAPVGDAQGLLVAHDSLYVNGKGPQGTGFYRLFDRDGDGVFEEVRLLRKWPIEMTEHGPHGIAAGPDGKLYVVNGNYTGVPADLSATSPHRNYAEDLLLPRQWDATGHAVGLLAPGGYVLRTDPDGKAWELFCGGLRNAYDLAFNADGELFTYDSDMERDLGSPWYRPTRVFHLVPGGEYGWRSGTGKWPGEYPDVLPSAVDVGRGSPTGVVFGTSSRFPSRYRRALFAADWAFGRILAIHLTPTGATYRGTVEPFVAGRPLNVTDLEFGPDGALYFITGGRGTRSQLFRVTAMESGGDEPSVPSTARDLRRSLEGSPSLDAIRPQLSSPDRWIRYAARVALERHPVESWRRNADGLGACAALARTGGSEDLAGIVDRVVSTAMDMDGLRVLQLAFIRLGKPEATLRSKVLAWLDPHYPSGSFPLDRELAQLLVYLEAEKVVPRSLRLLAESKAQEEQMHFAFVLRNVKSGWTAAERERYFRWFGGFADYKGDIGFPLFLRNVRADALKTVSAEERKALQPILDGQFRKDSAVFQRTAPVVRRWRVEELWPDVEKPGGRRNFTRGKAAFAKAQCLACHSFVGEGGAVGPDLTGVAKRLNRRDLFEAVFAPSKNVSDQYRNTLYQLDDGSVVLGRKMDESTDRIVVAPDLLSDGRVEIPRKRIARTKPSALSPMPEGLLDLLSKYEVLDLFAYLESDGKDSQPAPGTK